MNRNASLFDVAGRTAPVAGVASPAGRAISRALAGAGANLALVDAGYTAQREPLTQRKDRRA